MVDSAPKERRKKLNVLVIHSIDRVETTGIDSDERADKISHKARLKVAETVDNEIARVLNANGFVATVANIEDDPQRLRDALVVERPDLVINRVDEFDGDFNESAAAIPSLLDLEEYAHSGSSTRCLNNCANRVHTHLFLADAGIPAPKFASVHDINSVPSTDGFAYPLIVSEALDDIYIEEGHDHPLADRAELEAHATALAAECTLPLLVEEFISGTEVHAVVIGNKNLSVLPLVATFHEDDDDSDSDGDSNDSNDSSDSSDSSDSTGDETGDEPADESAPRRARASTSMEVQAEVAEMLDNSHLDIAQLAQPTADRVRALAMRAFRALHCRDVAQVDFQINSAGDVYVTNVRPMLDLSRQSPFGVAATFTEGGYEENIVDCVKLACERAKLDPRGTLIPPPAAPDVTKPTDPAATPTSPESETPPSLSGTAAPAESTADATETGSLTAHATEPTEAADATESAGSSHTPR